MKRVLLCLFALLLTVVFTGCNINSVDLREDSEIESFINSYTSHKPDENYYKTHSMDYYNLYDINLDEAEICNGDFGKEYYFVLTVSISGDTTAELTVSVDDNGNITAIESCISWGIISPLFKTSENICLYYTDILRGVTDLSEDEAWGYVADVWNAANGMPVSKVDVEGIADLLIMDNGDELKYTVILN